MRRRSIFHWGYGLRVLSSGFCVYSLPQAFPQPAREVWFPLRSNQTFEFRVIAEDIALGRFWIFCYFHPFLCSPPSVLCSILHAPSSPCHYYCHTNLNLHSFTDSAPPSHTTAGRQILETLAGLFPAEYNSALQLNRSYNVLILKEQFCFLKPFLITNFQPESIVMIMCKYLKIRSNI